MRLTRVWIRAFVCVYLGFFPADLDEPHIIIIIIFIHISLCLSRESASYRPQLRSRAHHDLLYTTSTRYRITLVVLHWEKKKKPCTEWIKHLTFPAVSGLLCVWCIWLCVSQVQRVCDRTPTFTSDVAPVQMGKKIFHGGKSLSKWTDVVWTGVHPHGRWISEWNSSCQKSCVEIQIAD